MPTGMQTAWFKARMRKVRVTQDDLGEALGCDRSVVSRIINGRQEIALSQILPLADALEVSSFEILKRSGFWDDSRDLGAQWIELYDAMPPEDRERIIDAVRALAKRSRTDS